MGNWQKEIHMPVRFGSTELISLLFGVRRIGKIAGELGFDIRDLRKAMNPEEKDDK